MNTQFITLFALTTALAFTGCQQTLEDFDDDPPPKQTKPATSPTSAKKSSSETPATSAAQKPAPVASPASSAPAAAEKPASPAPAATAAAAPAKANPPPSAGTVRVAAPVPGLQLRLVHREFSPADSEPEHKVVLLSEDGAAAPSEYEVLRPAVSPALYVKVTPEVDERAIAQIRIDTDGFNHSTVYAFTEEGRKSFSEATGKIAAANNAKGNGAGQLAFVLDGKPLLVSAFAPNPESKKWEAFAPTAFALRAASFSEALARESAFNARKNDTKKGN
jgi:hypothetical protein